MGKTVRAGLIGWPVTHSLSPALFRRLARAAGRPLRYRAYAVAPEGLEPALARLRREAFVGFNVTIPHKETVLLHLDAASRAAEDIGAVNCVVAGKSGLTGHNTDADGFLDALREHGVTARGLRVAVFGAGGAARAVAYALGSSKARGVRFLNRSPDRALRLAEEFGRRFPSTRFSAGVKPEAGTRLWVNATPLGMEGFPSASPLPRDVRLPRGAWAFDLVYRPAATPFLLQARAAGASTIGGLDMLLHQALRSWELWLGPLGPARRRALKDEVLRRLVCP